MEKFKLEYYIKKGKSQREISVIFKCSQTTIAYWLKKYNLKTKRTKGNKGIKHKNQYIKAFIFFFL